MYVDLAGSGDLLTIAIDVVGGLPGAVLVGGIDDLRATGIRRGMSVVAAVGGLSISEAAVTIQTSSARVWSAALPAPSRLTAERPATADLVRSIDVARGVAGARAPSAGLGPLLAGGMEPADPLVGVARDRIERQRWAFDAGDLASIIGEAVELVGLGPGLTPSGDDYLVGLLAGLESTGHRAHPALATAVAYAAPARTTAIGASVLGHAARGAFAERLHDVLAAIGDGRDDDIDRAIGRAMAYGASSGADTLVGLFVALDAAMADRARERNAAA